MNSERISKIAAMGAYALVDDAELIAGIEDCAIAAGFEVPEEDGHCLRCGACAEQQARLAGESAALDPGDIPF
jgi:hypothetical protein